MLSATAMGAAGLFGRKATPEGAVLGEALTLGRMAVGALGMLVLIALSRRLGQLRRTRLSWSVVSGGALLGLSLATYLSATVLTDLSRAVVLHYLGPVVATALARVFLKERVGRLDALSIGTAFAGMLLAAGLVGGESSGGEHETLGTVLGAASGVFYGGPCCATAIAPTCRPTSVPVELRLRRRRGRWDGRGDRPTCRG